MVDVTKLRATTLLATASTVWFAVVLALWGNLWLLPILALPIWSPVIAAKFYRHS